MKEAVTKAKSYVQDIFGSEGISNLGLEEIEFDDGPEEWLVTIGFSRPWNTLRNAMTVMTGDLIARRTYKVVRLKDAMAKLYP